MIVSLLQLMGFPRAKPVHSRAEESPPKIPSTNHDGASGPAKAIQDSPGRRHDVTTKSKKSSTAKEPPAKTVVKSKALLPAVSEPKVVKKPVAKKALEVKALAPATSIVKKSAEKLTSKNKPTNTATSASTVLAVKKPVETKEKVKPALPKSAQVAQPQPIAPPVLKPVTPHFAPQPKSVLPNSSTVTTSASIPVKAGRPSSRLAQLTVPSMAQSVASTAAKASFSQSTPSPVIEPLSPVNVKRDTKLADNWKTTPPMDLTDAELLAMPDSEYMNSVQLTAFRFKLTKLKQEILSSAGETTEHLREDTSVVPDPADRATIEEEHALELRTRDRERKLLKKIEQSIMRIDAGDYGYCDETGEAIGVGRLLARPTATLSLEAQQRRELKQKMFGD